MVKETFFKVLTVAMLASALIAGTSLNTVNAASTGVQLRWANPMQVYDVAVSDDGTRLAAVNGTGLYYFDADNAIPVWWYERPIGIFRSVALSADGDYVAAGDNDGYLHYFNDSRARIGNQTTSTWMSIDMGGPVERGTLDMSANGDYAVVGGTGFNVFYYANCTNMTGISQNPAWGHWVPVVDFLTVHMSSDGRYVAGGGTRGTGMGFVVFYKDCNIQPYPIGYAWFARNATPNPTSDLALSDDGYAVAAINVYPGGLCYWANATELTGDPNATWTNPGSFSCIDMSAMGDDVVAGGYYLTSVHFWTGCRTLEGSQAEDWVRLETTNVYDVAISVDGGTIAAPAMNLPSNYTACFLYSNGTLMDQIALPEFSNMVSMSTDGTTVAMAGPSFDSLYLFKLEVIPEFSPTLLALALIAATLTLAVVTRKRRKT